MTDIVEHYQIGTKYRVVIERSATKGILGYKIEVNSDDKMDAIADITELKTTIEDLTPLPEEK